jgi:hypothetical protein
MKISDFNIVIELDKSEMAKFVGGAQVDYFLKIDGVDGESKIVEKPEAPLPTFTR